VCVKILEVEAAAAAVEEAVVVVGEAVTSTPL